MAISIRYLTVNMKTPTLILAFFSTLLMDAGAAEIRFNRDVRPILSTKCFSCHGPDEKHRKAKLRLDEANEMILAKDLSGSEAWHRVHATDPDEIMPPPESGLEPLTDDEKATIKAWIEQGAAYEGHWAWKAPELEARPSVKNADWCQTPIDHFVLARLEAAGLEPMPEAEPHELVRRLSFDLRGIPPTPEEVATFIKDQEEGAYGRLVDRFLADPSFGERWTLEWMDVARYGDSSVFHADGPRDMWGWRDWVIKAFNNNMPYNDFSVKQLAGDLLPDSTRDDKVATAFLRNHGTTDEGGAIDEEYRVEYIVDRVKTTSMTWMGLTMECAQCHDHKYDPVSHEEYFQFYAFFNQTPERGMQTRNGNANPQLPVPTAEQQAAIEMAEAEWNKAQKTLKDTKLDEEAFASWVAERREKKSGAPPSLGEWSSLGPFSASSLDAAYKTSFFDEAKTSIDLSKELAGKTWKPQPNYVDGKPHSLGLPGNSAMYFTRVITVNEPRELKVSLGSDDGIRIWLNQNHVFGNNVGRGLRADQDSTTLNLVAGENRVLLKINNGGGGSGFYFKSSGVTYPDNIQKLIAKDTLEDKERDTLRAFYRDTIWPEGITLRAEIAAKKQALDRVRGMVTTVMVMEDMPKMRPTYVLMRGAYDQPDKEREVQANVPEFLPSLPGLGEGRAMNRLDLARWLVRDDHPLSGRVTVNRYWAKFFGQGLVSTIGDFGSQGAWPSHPQLLDWLSRDFTENGWDMKRFFRQIVMSATYRQSSKVDAVRLEKDPENILYSRGPRFRLQAEFIRDAALSISGLLNPEVGGPSTKPYQPPGLWNEVALSGNVRFVPDTGDKLYRKSMYIYWKRSAPHPGMRAFDAPTREKCVLERQRTNTPLQALVTLNDVQFVEAARAFATQLMDQKGFDLRLKRAYQLALSRDPDPVAKRVFHEMMESTRAEFSESPENAKALLAMGDSKVPEGADEVELATWTILMSMVLNLDETLTKQ